MYYSLNVKEGEAENDIEETDERGKHEGWLEQEGCTLSITMEY